jgi:glutathione S-transferase
MIKHYTLRPSGNAQKVRMALCFLGIPFEEISLAGGKHKQPEFLALNPLGQVPVLDDDGVVLRESGAILAYLAARYRLGEWDGHDAAERAQILQWLMLAANEVQNGPARLRLAALYGTDIDHAAATAITTQLLDVVETRLDRRDWIEAGRLTIADLALAPYLALSHQGGVELDEYPRTMAWTQRIAALPQFPPMAGWPKSGDGA